MSCVYRTATVTPQDELVFTSVTGGLKETRHRGKRTVSHAPRTVNVFCSAPRQQRSSNHLFKRGALLFTSLAMLQQANLNACFPLARFLVAVLLVFACALIQASYVSNPLLADVKRFKRSLAAGPNAATSYNLATALLSLGNSSAALPHLLDSLADPNFPGWHGQPHPSHLFCF
jgi:hypothetical protein